MDGKTDVPHTMRYTYVFQLCRTCQFFNVRTDIRNLQTIVNSVHCISCHDDIESVAISRITDEVTPP